MRSFTGFVLPGCRARRRRRGRVTDVEEGAEPLADLAEISEALVRQRMLLAMVEQRSLGEDEIRLDRRAEIRGAVADQDRAPRTRHGREHRAFAGPGAAVAARIGKTEPVAIVRERDQ